MFEVNGSQNRGELALQQSGNVRLEVQFDDELPEAVQVLVYEECQSCIQVDQSRAIVYTTIYTLMRMSFHLISCCQSEWNLSNFIHPPVLLFLLPLTVGRAHWQEKFWNMLMSCSLHLQSLYCTATKNGSICLRKWNTVKDLILHQGVPSWEEMEQWAQSKHFILVLDDLQQVCEKDNEVAKMFTVGSHHLNFSLIYLCHNIFGKGCFAWLINLNSHYLILFWNNRDVM